MATNDGNYKKIGLVGRYPSEDEEDAGSSGAQGQIEFHDFLTAGLPTRDDLLSPEEKQHLIAMHRSHHENHVKKQKEQRDLLQSVKENKTPLSTYRNEKGLLGGNSTYKANPILAAAAQFSGITDNKVSADPTQYQAETNENDRKREELQYQKQFRLGNMPTYTPRFER